MEHFGLQLLDILLTLAHLVIIIFNLTGWIWRRTRRWHLASIILTTASWLILGIWFGLGYCPITDWQWDVKARLGETKLPNSFITYFAEKITGSDISDPFVDTATAILFTVAALLSIYVNFRGKKGKPL